MITPKITNLGYSNLWTDMSTILGYASNFQKLITKLFANGEQGFFYDPSDMGTMFQDAAGTIPITAAGQLVGLIRDKSGRNNHAYQTASASRPLLQRNATTGAYYLAFDGADDFLVTNNINFTATDRVSLFAGVRKLSDATRALVVELGNNQPQAFKVFAPDIAGSPTYSAYSGPIGLGSLTQFVAPSSAVLTVKSDILTDTLKLKVNGYSVISNTDQGTGTYGNYPLYIGRRGGVQTPFNGHLYSLIGIGRLTTDSETIPLEKAIAKKVGVTLNV